MRAMLLAALAGWICNARAQETTQPAPLAGPVQTDPIPAGDATSGTTQTPVPSKAASAADATIPAQPLQGVPADASLPVSDGTSHIATAKMQFAPPPQGLLLDELVAVVNDDLVLESDVQEEMRLAAFEPDQANTRAGAINRLIDRMLIQEQEKIQPVKPVTDEELQAEIDQLRKVLPACAHGACSTDAQWNRFLADHGFTKSEFDARWRERMELLRFIDQRFRLGLRVNQQQIAAYYKETLLPMYARQHVAPPPLASVSSRIEEIVLEQQVNTLLDTWLKTLRTQGNVRLISGAAMGESSTAGAKSESTGATP